MMKFNVYSPLGFFIGTLTVNGGWHRLDAVSLTGPPKVYVCRHKIKWLAQLIPNITMERIA